ncbi:MAG TPA: LWXIA domain-containing protein, partial [Xanthomonadaceae bacterium]|nr:LWXIA domain-containing protein [Xanthomonadaceae bacterium]
PAVTPPPADNQAAGRDGSTTTTVVDQRGRTTTIADRGAGVSTVQTVDKAAGTLTVTGTGANGTYGLDGPQSPAEGNGLQVTKTVTDVGEIIQTFDPATGFTTTEAHDYEHGAVMVTTRGPNGVEVSNTLDGNYNTTHSVRDPATGVTTRAVNDDTSAITETALPAAGPRAETTTQADGRQVVTSTDAQGAQTVALNQVARKGETTAWGTARDNIDTLLTPEQKAQAQAAGMTENQVVANYALPALLANNPQLAANPDLVRSGQTLGVATGTTQALADPAQVAPDVVDPAVDAQGLADASRIPKVPMISVTAGSVTATGMPQRTVAPGEGGGVVVTDTYAGADGQPIRIVQHAVMPMQDGVRQVQSVTAMQDGLAVQGPPPVRIREFDAASDVGFDTGEVTRVETLDVPGVPGQQTIAHTYDTGYRMEYGVQSAPAGTTGIPQAGTGSRLLDAAGRVLSEQTGVTRTVAQTPGGLAQVTDVGADGSRIVYSTAADGRLDTTELFDAAGVKLGSTKSETVLGVTGVAGRSTAVNTVTGETTVSEIAEDGSLVGQKVIGSDGRTLAATGSLAGGDRRIAATDAEALANGILDQGAVFLAKDNYGQRLDFTLGEIAGLDNASRQMVMDALRRADAGMDQSWFNVDTLQKLSPERLQALEAGGGLDLVTGIAGTRAADLQIIRDIGQMRNDGMSGRPPSRQAYDRAVEHNQTRQLDAFAQAYGLRAGDPEAQQRLLDLYKQVDPDVFVDGFLSQAQLDASGNVALAAAIAADPGIGADRLAQSILDQGVDPVFADNYQERLGFALDKMKDLAPESRQLVMQALEQRDAGMHGSWFNLGTLQSLPPERQQALEAGGGLDLITGVAGTTAADLQAIGRIGQMQADDEPVYQENPDIFALAESKLDAFSGEYNLRAGDPAAQQRLLDLYKRVDPDAFVDGFLSKAQLDLSGNQALAAAIAADPDIGAERLAQNILDQGIQVFTDNYEQRLAYALDKLQGMAPESQQRLMQALETRDAGMRASWFNAGTLENLSPDAMRTLEGGGLDLVTGVAGTTAADLQAIRDIDRLQNADLPVVDPENPASQLAYDDAVANNKSRQLDAFLGEYNRRAGDPQAQQRFMALYRQMHPEALADGFLSDAQLTAARDRGLPLFRPDAAGN